MTVLRVTGLERKQDVNFKKLTDLCVIGKFVVEGVAVIILSAEIK